MLLAFESVLIDQKEVKRYEIQRFGDTQLMSDTQLTASSVIFTSVSIISYESFSESFGNFCRSRAGSLICKIGVPCTICFISFSFLRPERLLFGVEDLWI